MYNLPVGRIGLLPEKNPSVAVLAQRLDAATESLPANLTPAPQPKPPPGPVPVTGVTAGIPGTVTPVGFTPLATLTALRGDANVGDTALTGAGEAAWTTGQYVVILATTTNQGKAYWDGATWQNGEAP